MSLNNKEKTNKIYIDQYNLKKSKTSRKNIAIAWIDNKKGQ